MRLCASVTFLPLLCHGVHTYLFPNFHTVVWVRKRLHCICIGFACPFKLGHGNLTEIVWRIAKRGGGMPPHASTPNQKTTHGVQPHPDIVVCPSFLFSPVIRIVNTVFSWLPFSYEMEDLSQKENGAGRPSLVVVGYNRREKPASSQPLLMMGLCSWKRQRNGGTTQQGTFPPVLTEQSIRKSLHWRSDQQREEKVLGSGQRSSNFWSLKFVKVKAIRLCLGRYTWLAYISLLFIDAILI
jgi:hypothetical protein